MPQIGIRKLKTKASEILKEVREKRARYVVTYRGRPIATIQPLEDPGTLHLRGDLVAGSAWGELERLGEQISRGWTSEQSSLEILTRMRR
jgi:prevent-host-death family protein